MLSRDLISADQNDLIRLYRRLDIEPSHGSGVYLFDTSKKRYLDMQGGLAVNSLGYCHPEIVAAQTRQLSLYAHTTNYFVQKPQLELADALKRHAGMEKVFFCNSGTEALEAAVKLSRKWGAANGKCELAAFGNGFHGRTYAALSLMSQPAYRKDFGPFLDNCVILPFNDASALHSSIGDQTAAVILECIQGEGGVVPVSTEFVETLKKLRDKHGFLIIADEVQTGLGRTGKFLASMHWDLDPDIVLLAKALGGGLPLGALVASSRTADVFKPGDHGSTFGGNPVACAAGVATLEIISRDNLMHRATELGSYILESMNRLADMYPSSLGRPRGRGLMIGADIQQDPIEFRTRCMELGVVVNITHGNVLRLLPPLILERGHVDEAMMIFKEVIRSMQESVR
jgi:predicted acetylornithine/succinylornithine family transaminase